MRTYTIRNQCVALVVLAAAVFLAVPLWAADDGLTIRRNVGIDQRLDNQVPGDLEFRDESGRTVRLGDYFHDRPHILILVYFRCDKLCPMTLDAVRASLDALANLDAGKQFDVIVVSFDPKDKPSMAAERKEMLVSRYGRPGADEGWHVLTGDAPAIGRLTDAVGFRYVYDAKFEQYVHPPGIMILTPEGRVSRYLLNVAFPPTDVRLGLVEAADRKIGSPVDDVLLYCFHYDATKGKYTTSVMNFVRAGGVLVVASLGVFWFTLWRRERRRRRGGEDHHGDTEGTEKKKVRKV
jgi:protein SCO1